MVASIFLLIIFIVLFLLIFSFSSQSTLNFTVKDFQGNSLSNAYVVISDSQQKEIFKGTVNDASSKKISLKLKESYLLKASKEGFPDYQSQITINDTEQNVSIVFSESVEYGILKIKLRDIDNKKTISSGTVKVNYKVNNLLESEEAIINIFDDHFATLEVPLFKDLEIIVKADGYEDFKETNYRITSVSQEKVIDLDVSSLSFEGKGKVTFVVLDTSQEMIDDAEVEVYNLAGDLITTQNTIDGKALVYVDTGETISFIIKKEGYKTFVSDPEVSLRIRNLEETITSVLELGGDFIDVSTIAKHSFLSLEEVTINLYNSENYLVDSGVTDELGEITFKGINVDSELLVTACKQEYLCEYQLINLNQETKAEFLLEKIDVSNSAVLNIFVVDEKNMPVSSSTINISIKKEDLEVPVNQNIKTDVSGSTSLALRVNETYVVSAIVGDLFVSEEITIDPLRENKIIFVVDNASKEIKLDLYDQDGLKINSGHLLIKTKDDTVIYDQNLSFGDDVIFNTGGYKDLLLEYTDENFSTSFINFTSDDADNFGYLKLDLKKQTNSSENPIIEFAGVVDNRGIKTNYVTPNKEYFLVFDVLFPENAYRAEMHVRAGDDTQIDSEEMSYGISGFSAMDTVNFRYGTTYNKDPAPGLQAIDYLNEGSSQVINKWLDLKWSSEKPLGNKQVKIKVNAIDSTTTKLKFNYRVWFEENNLYFRDPVDPLLDQSYSNSQRASLYAETKEVVVDLFDVPLDCSDEFCVSYKFVDSKDNSFDIDDFFAVKDESYSLETNIYSLKNSQLNLLAETSKSFPLLSFEMFTDNKNDVFESFSSNDIFEVTRDNVLISQNNLKKVYLSFISKEIGTAYIDLKGTDTILGNEVFNDRLSFNVYDKKDLRVSITPDIFLPYGSQFSVEVLDSQSLKPVTDAFISFYDQRGNFLSSQRATRNNGRNGVYNFTNNFNVSNVLIVVESYGYAPYKKELFVVDDSLLSITPNEVLVNLGLDQLVSSSNFTLQNNGAYVANNIRFGEPVWLDGSEDIFIEVRGVTTINKNSTQTFEVIVTVPNTLNFDNAQANVPIYATIGEREVTRMIPVRINKGLLLGECLEITENANTFLGLNLAYSPPNVYNTPFTNYNYQGSNQNQNPLLAQSQTYNNYSDYLSSQNYTQNPTSSNNTSQYVDPNYYTYYSSKPDATQTSTENTTFFIIKNNCEQAVTFTPESVLTSSVSNNELSLSLPHVTVLPGEEKAYDILIKNSSDRKQPTKYSYDILWHNNFYSVPSSKLNVDLLDLSKALWIMPDLIQVPITQLHSQQAAVNSTRFMIKNIGSVPITDIQVSQYPKMVSSNITVKEYPREIPVILPGASIPVDLEFRVNIAKSTMDNMYMMVTGKAAGVSDPIHATTQIVFSISSPNCIKISNKKLDFSLKVGDKRAKNITLTNYCAEPVSIIGIDKREQGYTETFGDNPLRIFPSSGNNIIYPNQSSTYNIELTAKTLGGSPRMPLIIIGQSLNSGNPVTSEDFTISVNIQDEQFNEMQDRDVSIISSVPVCGDLTSSETLSRPLLSLNNCSQDSGYCDAVSSSDLILKKIEELQNQVKQVSAQAQAKTMDTQCSIEKARDGYCKISEIGGGVDALEFTFYMQNDLISTELIRNALLNSNYSFKNYFVETNPFDSGPNPSLGVYLGGNKIFISNQFTGCGKYTVEIDGYIAATQDYIYPERAYYYVSVLKKEETEHCEKNIINYLNFLPWNLGLDKHQRFGTWVTLFTGDETISKGLINGVGKFKKEDVDLRYVFQRDVLSSRNNVLNVSVKEILENPEALAKISFNDNTLHEIPNPEQINLTLNSLYQTENLETPEKVSREFINIISSMLANKEFSADVCVSEDKSYMLILDVIKAGDLFFVEKDPSVVLKEENSCLSLTLKSSIDETLKISSSSVEGAIVGFKKKEDDSLKDTINLTVAQNKDANFFACIKPETVSLLPSLVGRDVKVIAQSIYSSDGVIGNRNTEIGISLSSCATTPKDLLLESYKEIINEHKKPLDQEMDLPKNIYALVDWQGSYSSEDKEDLCQTLQKIIDSGEYNEELFYNYENINCEIKDVSQKTNSKINKGLINAGEYFGRCAGACSACYGLSAALLPTSIAAAAFDCLLFSCGLPALSVFASSFTDDGIAGLLDRFFGYMFVQDEFKLFSTFADNVKAWFTGAISSTIPGALKAGSTAAAAPLVYSESVISIADPSNVPVVTQNVSGNKLPTFTASNKYQAIKDINPNFRSPSTNPLASALSGKSLDHTFTPPKMNPTVAQKRNYLKYLSDTGDVVNYEQYRTKQLASKFISSSGSADATLNVTAIKKAASHSAKDLKEFRNLIHEGSFTPINNSSKTLYGAMIAEDLDKFISEADDAIATAKASRGAATGPTTTATRALSKVEFDAMQRGVDDQINLIDDEIKKLTDKVDDLKKNDSRSRFNPRKVRSDPNRINIYDKQKLKASGTIADIEKKITELRTVKADVTSYKSDISKIKPNNAGHYDIPDSVIDKYENTLKGKKFTTATRSSKWARGVGGFFRGVACGLTGNYFGIKGLENKGKTNLNHAIEFETNISFEKNVMYVVEMDYLPPLTENDFNSRYVVRIVPYSEKDIESINSMPSRRVDSCVSEVN